MPEWITPLLRVLAPMPSLGVCSTRNTSLQRCETTRATAQPTTPPPMMTMLARSMANRIDDLRGETKGQKKEAGKQGGRVQGKNRKEISVGIVRNLRFEIGSE